MKKNIFLNKVHTYDFEIIDGIYTLSYADSDRWSSGIRGTKAISIEDNGNDLIIKYHDGKSTKKTVDYDIAHALNILLTLMHEEENFSDFVAIDDDKI